MKRLRALVLALSIGSLASSQGEVLGIGGSEHLTERIVGRRKADETGGAGTAKALDASLGWILRHQGEDGGWAPSGSPPPGGGCVCVAGDPQRSPASTLDATALALLALQGSGLSMTGTEHPEALRRGVRFLLDRLDDVSAAPGPVRARAVLALVEAWDFSRSPILRRHTEVALATLPALALDDDETLDWVAQCVLAAERAGVEVPELHAALMAHLGADSGPELERTLARGVFRVEGEQDIAPEALAALAVANGAGPEILFQVQNAAHALGPEAFARTNPLAQPTLVAGLVQEPPCARGAWSGPDGRPAGLEATAWAALTLEVSFRLPAPE